MPIFLPLAVAGSLIVSVASVGSRPRPKLIKALAHDVSKKANGVVVPFVAQTSVQDTTGRALQQTKLGAFFDYSRGRQWDEIASTEEVSENPATLTMAGKEEQDVDRYLLLSTTALGLAITGVAFPPLGLLSGAVSLYSCFPIFQDAYTALIKEHRLRWTVLDSIALFGMLAARYFTAFAVGGVIYFVGVKMMLKTEDRSRQSLMNIFGQQPRTVWVLVHCNQSFDRLEFGYYQAN